MEKLCVMIQSDSLVDDLVKAGIINFDRGDIRISADGPSEEIEEMLCGHSLLGDEHTPLQYIRAADSFYYIDESSEAKTPEELHKHIFPLSVQGDWRRDNGAMKARTTFNEFMENFGAEFGLDSSITSLKKAFKAILKRELEKAGYWPINRDLVFYRKKFPFETSRKVEALTSAGTNRVRATFRMEYKDTFHYIYFSFGDEE